MKDKNWEKELFKLICKYNREFNGAFVITEEFKLTLEAFISSLLKAQKSDLKKKVGGMKYDTEGTLLDVDQERFEDGFNEACDKFLKLLEK